MIHIPALDAYGMQIDNSTFAPMKITFEMRSPVVTADYVFLDGLISSAVFKDNVSDYQDLPENRNELIHIPLPIKQHGAIEMFYAASIGHADRVIDGVDHWRKRAEVESKRKIQVGSGQYKMYDMPMPTQWAHEWIFYADGCIDEIRRLLTTHISAIGKKCSQGFGQINKIVVDPTNHEWGVVRGGVPMRPIPVSAAGEFGLSGGVEMWFAYRPPYWHRKNLAMCVMPTGAA